ncbi:F0F1 ATP synthase subunit epsilon [Vagococcus xieshaowenii]|uniref:ATP synthase epsilon chain n=1 Tax=Vagococcus xieshaowenii TaxID=2562451 RepID=A0AAJ5EF96_9ENTE|nr:F0F1 ATP synthase subunit epsilon [Vagococcus xieshaowenii]QCA28512.1 F0F1 ATP synthase subunit epsilon [Vagococcus xieshaowenii]TFZ42734.1 F0F1 ATP synthase subunit epsilon [Vagococcus xieshaowenii]
MNKMEVQVVTPNGLVYDGEAGFVLATTPQGQLGIMANHQPIIAPVKISSLIIKEVKGGDILSEIAVNGGILEVRDNIVSILANSAERAQDIDVERAERAKDRAEQDIQYAKEHQESDKMKRAEVALARAINRIHISKK